MDREMIDPNDVPHEVNGAEQDDVPVPNNPAPGDFNLDIDLDAIKGDVIGQTMYSERFVLKTLLGLNNINWSVDFENDLNTLWDMTTDSDVVAYLTKFNFIDIAIGVITSNLNNVRLVEILVGMIGNICCQLPSLEGLLQNPSAVSFLVNLIEYKDALTLVQLMRFYYAACTDPQSSVLISIQGHSDFMKHVAFIIANGRNDELVNATFKFYSLILRVTNRLSGSDIFLEPQLLKSTVSYYKKVYKNLLKTSSYQKTREYSRIIRMLAGIYNARNRNKHSQSEFNRVIKFYILLLQKLKKDKQCDAYADLLDDINYLIIHRSLFSKRLLIALLTLIPYHPEPEKRELIMNCIENLLENADNASFILFVKKYKRSIYIVHLRDYLSQHSNQDQEERDNILDNRDKTDPQRNAYLLSLLDVHIISAASP